MQELYFLFSDFVNVGHSRTLQVQKLSGRQVFKKVKKFKIGGVKETEWSMSYYCETKKKLTIRRLTTFVHIHFVQNRKHFVASENR
jgi:hypothetical protein